MNNSSVNPLAGTAHLLDELDSTFLLDKRVYKNNNSRVGDVLNNVFVP